MMLITEIIKGKKGKLAIHTDAGISFPIYQKEAAQYHLEEGTEITTALWEQIRAEVLDKRAIKRAMFILQRMERTEKQLRQKLKENGYPDEIIEVALEYVKRYHYVDDARYAATYIRYHQEEKSPMQMKTFLMQKGVPVDYIEQAMEEEYTVDENVLIKKYLEKKHYDPETFDQKERYKLYQFLQRKGFSGSAIRRNMDLFD